VIAPPCERVATRTHSSPTRASRRRTKSRGQSVTEFAIILPVMLAFLGLAIDFARVFQAWITLESATRDAAEAVATDTTVTNSTQALDLAKRTICVQAQNVPGFTRSALTSPDDVELCTAPSVTVTSFSVDPAASGASTKYPLGTATVQASLPFRPLLAYPFITENGSWTIVTSGTFQILRGRE
jgi:Flp pilus assembly protein TadG